MSAWLLLFGISCHATSGVPGLFMRRQADGGQRFSVILQLLGSVAGIAGALWSLRAPPVANTILRIDGLAVLFLLPIFLIPALGGIYGLSYWKHAEHAGNGRKLRLFFGLVTAALAGVTIAANSVLFLMFWEIMALSAFFLVTTEDENPAVREAGWIYLVTTHLSTLCLFALFALLQSLTGSYALEALPADAVTPALATVLFLLATLGFGIKAGVMPLHVWLPGAHAMAPSHVSALMSGVLIKIGIYGLVRILSLLPLPPLWWGELLLTLGVLSGVLGVVLALGQHDLKRLLAYHSIENIGIILLGLGLAMIGRTLHHAEWIALGLAGALLHVWNHGLFKALLFLSAGSVIHATHTREMDRMGGIAKAMPRTALYFAVGAVAICGLPPLNGFVSELLIYLGLFRSINSGSQAGWAGAAFAAPALAMIGALALACFVKAFGAVFLGTARSEAATRAREVGPDMTGPMMTLAALCLFIGLAPSLVAPILEPALLAWAPELAMNTPALTALAPLGAVSLAGVALCGAILLAAVALARGLRHGTVAAHGTWDCGYAAPTPRMQYTATSFAQILVGLFSWALRPQVHEPDMRPVFAGHTRFDSHVPDLVLDNVLRPLFRFCVRIMQSLRCFQAGSIQAYLFYIVVFLIGLLLWR